MPRQRDYGGAKQAPVGLIVARKFVGLNTNAAKKCVRIAVSTGKRCRQPAMRGTCVCLRHGGAGLAKWKGTYTPTAHGQRALIERALKPE